MKTPKTHIISNIGNGFYIHLGLENMIFPILKKYHTFINIPNKVLKIGINLDGLPLSRSSKSQLWPILIDFTNCNLLSKYVLPIGIFHGNTKPKSIHEFFNPFLIDLLTLLNNGINVDGYIYQFEVGHVVCDSPAKSYLLNVKSFNAYYGCTSCTQEGTYINNRMAFLDVESPLRTDESFRSKTQEEYHKGSSPLELLPINLINDVCLDYMHNTCIGVTKRLIEFWVKGKKDVRLIDENIVKISNQLINLRSYVPSEFSRLPRGLDYVEYYKATELRMFLLHSGLIVLKCHLNKQMYSHFKLLVCALRILTTSDICQTLNNLAQSLLNEFVSQYSSLYGAHFVTYNVHIFLCMLNSMALLIILVVLNMKIIFSTLKNQLKVKNILSRKLLIELLKNKIILYPVILNLILLSLLKRLLTHGLRLILFLQIGYLKELFYKN